MNITLPDMRSIRAERLAAEVMHAIDGFLDPARTPENIYRKVHTRLLEMFHAKGVEVVTDEQRALAGLYPRNDKGWTAEELAALDARRMLALTAPFQYLGTLGDPELKNPAQKVDPIWR